MTRNISNGDTLTIESIEQKGTLPNKLRVGQTLTVTREIGDRLILTQYHEENPSLPIRQVTAYKSGDTTLKLGNKNAINFHQIVTVS